jgi:putative ABC transport system substrate-binding protein
MNNRRKLLIALGACALTAPLHTFAQQQGKVWHVGFLALSNREASVDSSASFVKGMRELGYIEGQNLTIEWRFADGKFERLPVLAAELAQMKAAVIVTIGPQATSAAQKATTAIPIVMVTSVDPVGSGFVKTLAHPGGNITGLTNLAGDLGPKQFEMLFSMVPNLTRVAVLVNPSNKAHIMALEQVRSAAQVKSAKILAVKAQTAPEIEKAFFAMIQGKAGAVIVALDPFFVQQQRQIAELAAKSRLPSIFPFREYVEAGGLMSYGRNLTDQYRRLATFVDKIFKGAKPGDLPVEQPTNFELIINGKTAKALGLTIPQSLLISAEMVID